jgi:hypothetical protein
LASARPGAALAVFGAVSSTISSAGLSSRNPLNDAPRSIRSCVQSRNSISPTRRGATQRTPFSAPGGNRLANAGFSATIASSSWRSERA